MIRIGKLYEAAVHFEVYRAIANIYPDVSPEVGGYFGIKGFIDFYINDQKKFGIELLREGPLSRLHEHIGRLKPNGKYAGLKLNEHAVLDIYKYQSNKLYFINAIKE